MISAKFKYIDRKKENLLVLIPGWACDWRIFAPLNLEFNYLIPDEFSPFTFAKELLETLKENQIKEVSLFGWSLGGFVAVEFALKYPDLVDEVFLVSIRRRYSREKLREIKRHLQKNKKGYLYKFYTHCFPQKEKMSWFKENLLSDYCQRLDLSYLFQTLDYLEDAEIKPELLNKIKKIKIIHGENDQIAPAQEAMDIKNRLNQATFICIKDAGHIPFLREDFAKYI